MKREADCLPGDRCVLTWCVGTGRPRPLSVRSGQSATCVPGIHPESCGGQGRTNRCSRLHGESRLFRLGRYDNSYLRNDCSDTENYYRLLRNEGIARGTGNERGRSELARSRVGEKIRYRGDDARRVRIGPGRPSIPCARPISPGLETAPTPWLVRHSSGIYQAIIILSTMSQNPARVDWNSLTRGSGLKGEGKWLNVDGCRGPRQMGC